MKRILQTLLMSWIVKPQGGDGVVVPEVGMKFKELNDMVDFYKKICLCCWISN